ncbi:hypothetical protein DERF_015874 [Dermatophagoides farinae]|uniref:Uncharacterized protein n=1 Tax=Dermatophagoides farinae TaxID=6954 RepID=A0A922KRP6_DERFA|nr:hypothetical protein DERF_015874 [Dermatophagoides farinae]
MFLSSFFVFINLFITTTTITNIDCLSSKNSTNNSNSNIFKFECKTLKNVRHIFSIKDGLFIIFVVRNFDHHQQQQQQQQPSNTLSESYWTMDKLSNLYIQCDWLYSTDSSGNQRRLLGFLWEDDPTGKEETRYLRISAMHEYTSLDLKQMADNNNSNSNINSNRNRNSSNINDNNQKVRETTYYFDEESGILFFIRSKLNHYYDLEVKKIGNIYQPTIENIIYTSFENDKYILFQNIGEKVTKLKMNVDEKRTPIMIYGLFQYKNRYYVYLDAENIYNVSINDSFQIKSNKINKRIQFDQLFKCYGEKNETNMKLITIMIVQIIIVIIMVIINVLCLFMAIDWRQPITAITNQIDKFRIKSNDLSRSRSRSTSSSTTATTNTTLSKKHHKQQQDLSNSKKRPQNDPKNQQIKSNRHVTAFSTTMSSLSGFSKIFKKSFSRKKN